MIDPRPRAAPQKCVRLLLAEDEWLIVERIERALSGSRYVIAAKAPSLDQALHLASTGGFDAAILDGNLGGERTVSLAERLRHNDIPFLLLTTYGPAARSAQLAAGLRSKPFTGEALVLALETLMLDYNRLDQRPFAG